MLFNEKVLDLALSQIGLNIGWQSMSQQSMRILQTLVIKYIRELGKATMGFANNGNRHEALLSDVILAMRQMNVSLEEIQEYINEVDSVPFIKGNCIPLYPCPPPKGYVRINFPGVDEIATRPEYMEPWLPSLNFGEKSDEKDSANGTSGETNGQDGPTEGETCPDGDGSMTDPKNGVAHERLNDHIYLSSVYIDAEGRVVGIGGREGVAPDSRLPPKDDYEEKKIAEEEEKKRKSLEAEEQERKKKQKVEEVNKPIKTKIKEKPLTKLKKTDTGLKKKGALGVKGNAKKKFIVKVSLSGLHSGIPTAKPSPSLASRSPTDFLDDDDDDDEFDSLYINSKENSKIDEDTSANYENTINEVIERFRLEHDLDPEEIPDDDFDFKDSNLDVKNPKLKKIKKKILKKGKKKDSFDLTIDNVIKTSLGSEIVFDEDANVKDNVYTFSEENNLDIKLKEETGVDAKEAAKILVSLSEDVPKKQKKADLKKSLKVSSPPPPVMSTFVGTKGSNASFPKVAPGSTPMSPNSNPTMFNNPFSSPLRSPPQPPIPTPPLFSDFYQLGPPISFQSSSKSTPLPKPALKTLAEKKALPPIDENLLLKKEKKEKKVKEKAADKKKNKEKEREKEREKKREKEREREREKEREREREKEKEKEKEREREREREKEEKAKEKEREREREREKEREREREREKEREREREREREKVKEREREKEKEKEKSKAKEKSKNIDKDDIKHEAKESKKLKKLKKSNNDDNWLDKKSDNNISSKLSIKAFTRHDESPVASPASSSSSNRLVIRTPPLSETIDQKDKKESKKKKQKAITSPSIDEPPTKKAKQIVKEKVKDKGKVKDDKKSKDKLKDDASCVLITETITKEERGQQEDKLWYCPVCSDPYDGHGNMIGCDGCDDWYHWICVGITEDPGEEESWFCVRCIQKQKAIETKVLKKTKKSDKPKQSKASKSSKTSKVGSSSSSSLSWSCAVCNKSSNSKPCICCDSCDGWFHWPCVGIVVPPNEEDSWYCADCIKNQ